MTIKLTLTWLDLVMYRYQPLHFIIAITPQFQSEALLETLKLPPLCLCQRSIRCGISPTSCGSPSTGASYPGQVQLISVYLSTYLDHSAFLHPQPPAPPPPLPLHPHLHHLPSTPSRGFGDGRKKTKALLLHWSHCCWTSELNSTVMTPRATRLIIFAEQWMKPGSDRSMCQSGPYYQRKRSIADACPRTLYHSVTFWLSVWGNSPETCPNVTFPCKSSVFTTRLYSFHVLFYQFRLLASRIMDAPLSWCSWNGAV